MCRNNGRGKICNWQSKREREREGGHNDRKSRERAKETDIDR